MEEGARCNELSTNGGTGKGGKGAQRRKRGGKEGCGVQAVEYNNQFTEHHSAVQRVPVTFCELQLRSRISCNFLCL